MQHEDNRFEDHPCGLRRLSSDFHATYGGPHLRHCGEAGPFWLFLMGLVRFRMNRTARALERDAAAAQSARSRGDGAAAGGPSVLAVARGNSIQNVVPTPTAVSNPICPPIASTS